MINYKIYLLYFINLWNQFQWIDSIQLMNAYEYVWK